MKFNSLKHEIFHVFKKWIWTIKANVFYMRIRIREAEGYIWQQQHSMAERLSAPFIRRKYGFDICFVVFIFLFCSMTLQRLS